MHPRVVLNVVYAHLVGEASPEDRERFDTELYAPVDGAGDLGTLLGPGGGDG